MIVCGHHLISDLNMLVRNGHTIPPLKFFDTEVAARWLYPDQKDFRLEHLALRMTDMADWRPSIKRMTMEDFEALSDEELGWRCGGDAEAAVKLKEKLEPEITRQGLDKIYALAMDVLPILARVGGIGMAVNTHELTKLAVHLGGPDCPKVPVEGWLAREKALLEQTLNIKNVSSSQQLAPAIYGSRFKATSLHKTETGAASTDKKSLMWARYIAREKKQDALQDLLSRLLTFSREEKLYNTYYRGWLHGPARGTRVYSIYSLGRTSTGRLSSYDENLQNIPKRVRKLVVPSQDYDYIVQVDYKQLELAVAAHISQDAVLLDWVRRGLDIHALQAAYVLGLPQPKTQADFARFKEEHNTERQIGKRANFSTLYGVSAASLSWQAFEDSEGEIWIPPDDAQRYIDAFFVRFEGYNRYKTDLSRRLARGEKIASDFGRWWVFPNIAAGLRRAQNYPIQATASDLTILVMRTLDGILRRNGWKSRIIGEVHDSLVFESTKRELQAFMKLIKRVCEAPNTTPFGFSLRVPLTVEVQYGFNWGELQTV